MLTALYFFDWVLISISFFNTVALLWLGLTVLLNAERRTWGTWAAGGGMLLGALVFIGHTAVVARVIGTFHAEMEVWWWLGWLPFVSAPYLWYVVIAWYTGVLRGRYHRTWLLIVSLLGLSVLALHLFANPLPSYSQVLQRAPTAIFRIGGIPVVILVYPAYSMLCIVLSLLALRHPAASERFMGDEARRRARPWLAAASLMLLAVSLAVGMAATWLLQAAGSGQVPVWSFRSLALFIAFDLCISGLIAVVVVLMGRAVVSYEVFTGKALPRGGLFRHWRNSLILAAGYGALMAGSLAFTIPSIYRLLLATVLMTVFYALISWRSYRSHERSIEQLRPFVASQHIYEQLLRPATPLDVDAARPLQALCEDVLHAQSIHLVSLGPLAPLVGAMSYPPDVLPLPANLESIISHFHTPYTLYVPLEPAHYGGASWAVPLWSERGLIGVLFLGARRDGGLYTQEEIEIARATGERLIDTQASAEMARRLMDMQRQRLSESQVLDRRTRRVLHDDVLPELHTAMLLLGSAAASARRGSANGSPQPPDQAAQAPYGEVMGLLTSVHQQIANLLHALPPTAAAEVSRLGLIGALRQVIEHELGSNFDGVTWQSNAATEQAARHLPALAAEVLFYAAREAMRNAARYGRSSDSRRPLYLTIAAAWQEGLELRIADDGVGITAARPSRGATGGSGQGLALHSTMMAVIGGTLTLDSAPGSGTRVTLTLPLAGTAAASEQAALAAEVV